jgi:hypothetical protein
MREEVDTDAHPRPDHLQRLHCHLPLSEEIEPARMIIEIIVFVNKTPGNAGIFYLMIFPRP